MFLPAVLQHACMITIISQPMRLLLLAKWSLAVIPIMVLFNIRIAMETGSMLILFEFCQYKTPAD